MKSFLKKIGIFSGIIGLGMLFWFSSVEASQVINNNSTPALTSSTNGNFTYLQSTYATTTGNHYFGSGLTINPFLPSNTLNALYNIAGNLFFNDNELLKKNLGGANNILYLDASGEVSTSTDFTYTETTGVTHLTGLDVFGFVNFNTITLSASGTLSATGNNFFVNVATNVNPITVTLPLGADTGRVYWINDIHGNAGTNNITILTQGGATINGASSYTINQNYGCLGLQNNSTKWTVIAYCPTGMLPGFSSYNPGSIYAASNTSSLTQVTPSTAGEVLQSAGAGSVPIYGRVNVSTAVTGTVPVANGGTNLTTIAQGDLLYGSATDVISKLAKNTSATRYLSNTGASNNPAWSAINLTNGTSGMLPVGSGGTGAGTFTQGSVVFAGASGVYTQDNSNLFFNDSTNRLGIGTATPAKTLDVVGEVQNVLQNNYTLTQRATLNLGANTDGNFGIDVRDNMVYYVSQNASNFYTIDVTTSSAPSILGTLNISGALLSDTKVQGDFAVVLDRASTAKLYVVNISKPKSPTLVGTLTLGSGIVPRRLKLNGTRAYFTGQSSNKIYTVSFADPANPTLLSTITPTISAVYAMELEDGILYAGGTNSSSTLGAISILDIASNPNIPLELATSTVASTGIVVDMAASNHYLYTVPFTGSQPMSIFDVRDPSTPVEVSSSTIISTLGTTGIYITKNLMFMTSQSNLHTFNIANPTSPVKLATTTISTLSGGFIVGRGNDLFVAHNQSGPSTGYMGVFEIPQAEFSMITVDSLEAGNTQVTGNLLVRGFIDARQGLSVGRAGIQSQGTLSTSSTIIGGGAEILRHLSATSSLNFGATAAGACDLLTMTVTGAADGDTVYLGIPSALAASDNYQSFQGYVSAANTVTVKRCNLLNTVTALSNPAAADVRADVWKH